jgi:phosphatidylinositol alpha-mannosyltransferase
MGENKKLRIALFFSSNPTSAGGVQEHVLYLSEELRKRGHEVTLFGPEGNASQYKNYHPIGYTIQVPLPNGNWTSIQMLKPFSDINKIFSENKFDILHIQEPYIPILGWQLVDSTNIPKVATFHSAWDDTSIINALNGIVPLFKDKFSQKIGAAIFVSRITQKRWGGLCSDRVSQYIVYNAVDRDSFCPILKIKRKKIRLLFLGRMVQRKGVVYLLDAFRMIARKFPHAMLEFVGGGPEVPNTLAYIKHHRLGKQIKYRGEIFGKKRIRYFQDADVFCAPYFDEASPLTILEAMSCGCTIVGFENEAVKESLGSYPHFELLAEQKNTKALAQALTRSLVDSQLRDRIRTWCIGESKKYSWSIVAEQTEKIYKNILRR